MTDAPERTPLSGRLTLDLEAAIRDHSPSKEVAWLRDIRDEVAALEQDRKDLLDSIDHLDDVFDEFSRVAEHLFGVRHTMKERLRALTKPEGE